MSIVNGNKITTLMVSAANGDVYGDAERKLFRGMQTLVMPNVKSITSTPPTSPSFGDTYLVGASPTGAWAGQANAVVAWAIDSQDGTVTSGAWEFYPPQQGWQVYNQANSFVYVYNGSAWVQFFSGLTGTANQVAISASGVLSVPNSFLFPGSFAPQKAVVTASSTTNINPAAANSFRVNLNNVASISITFSNGTFDGQEVALLWAQGGTTASTVTFASNIHGATVPTATVNVVTTQSFTWDATNSIWYALIGAGM